MSEHVPNIDRAFNQLLEGPELKGFEAAVRDPKFADVIRMAKEFNESLHTESDVSSRDAWDIVEGLDKEWGIRGGVVQVTGRIRLPMASGEIEEVPVDNIEMMTDGFTVHTDRQLNGDERYTIKHHLAVPRTKSNGAFAMEWATAEVDGVEVRPRVHSFEHVKSWLEAYHGDIKADLDGRLSSARSNEVELFDALRGMTVAVDDGADNRELAAYMSEYVNDVVPLDKEVPYSLTLKSSEVVGQASQDLPDETEGDFDVIASVHGVEVAPQARIDDDGNRHVVLRFFARLIIHGRGLGQEPTRRSVPVETIWCAESIRRRFYGDDTGVES